MMMVTSGPAMALMRRAVSMPSISGIFQSISIISKYLPRPHSSCTRPMAFWPLSTHSAMIPISLSVTIALSHTVTSSSTTRVFSAEKLGFSFFLLRRRISSSVIPSSTSTVNSDPIPLIERTVIVPPIISTILFDMASPRPVPPYRAVVPMDSCAKGSNI